MLHSRGTAPVLLLLAVLSAGCSADDDTTRARTGGSPSPLAAAPSSAPSPAPSAAAAPPSGAPTPAAPDAVTSSAAEPSGGPLTVTAVRVARQEGFDRVVLELAGTADGIPGWQVAYEADPRRQGSGEPVDVAGDAVLVVRVLGAGYPFDTQQTEASTTTVPGDTVVVQDMVLGSVFEGTYEAFIGASEPAPFRVTRLTDPTRVVVDIDHP